MNIARVLFLTEVTHLKDTSLVTLAKAPTSELKDWLFFFFFFIE